MSSLFHRKSLTATSWVAIAITVFATAAHAQPVLDEQSINEQAITNALKPEDSGIVTRGFVLDNKRPPGSGGGHAAAHDGTASLLISFTSNSSVLTSQARAALDKVGRAMQSEQLTAYKFQIEGHADPRGSLEANMRLSVERAEAVAQYLSTQAGVARERLIPVGKGSSEPMFPNNPGAPENRRVTIVTLKQ